MRTSPCGGPPVTPIGRKELAGAHPPTITFFVCSLIRKRHWCPVGIFLEPRTRAEPPLPKSRDASPVRSTLSRPPPSRSHAPRRGQASYHNLLTPHTVYTSLCCNDQESKLRHFFFYCFFFFISTAPSESESDRSASPPPPPIRRDSPELRDHSSKYKSVEQLLSTLCLWWCRSAIEILIYVLSLPRYSIVPLLQRCIVCSFPKHSIPYLFYVRMKKNCTFKILMGVEKEFFCHLTCRAQSEFILWTTSIQPS